MRLIDMMLSVVVFFVASTVSAYPFVLYNANPQGPALFAAVFSDGNKNTEWRLVSWPPYMRETEGIGPLTIIFSAMPQWGMVARRQAEAMVDGQTVKGVSIFPVKETIKVGAMVVLLRSSLAVNVTEYPKKCTQMLTPLWHSEPSAPQPCIASGDSEDEKFSWEDFEVCKLLNPVVPLPFQPAPSTHAYSFKPVQPPVSHAAKRSRRHSNKE